MKILVTGISGFVGRHFVEMLQHSGNDLDLLGLYHQTQPSYLLSNKNNYKLDIAACNLLDPDEVEKVVQNFQPQAVLHLAAQSSVADSWKNPAKSVINNTTMFMNIVEAIRNANIPCKIVSIGSAEEYGMIPGKDGYKLKEDFPIHPQSPYGIARQMQSNMVELYAKNYGMDILHTRSFNHFGPYQLPKFVIPSFAKQIAEQYNAGSKSISIQTGDLSIVRDFTDVRDVVKAYWKLIENGKSGEIYNVCSGEGHSLSSIIDHFSKILDTPISTTQTQSITRPSDTKVLIGDNCKIKSDLNWNPEISFQKSLNDLLEYWLIETKTS